MNDSHKIIKPLSLLPPPKVRTFHFSAAGFVDFAEEHKIIVVGYDLHEHAGSAATYKIDEKGDTMTLKGSGSESLDNVQIFKIEMLTASNVDLIVKCYSILELKAMGALGVN